MVACRNWARRLACAASRMRVLPSSLSYVATSPPVPLPPATPAVVEEAEEEETMVEVVVAQKWKAAGVGERGAAAAAETVPTLP